MRENHAERGHAGVRRRDQPHGEHRRGLDRLGLSRERATPADLRVHHADAPGVAGQEVQHPGLPGLRGFHQRSAGRAAGERPGGGGGARQPRRGRRHGHRLEMRDRERHPEGHRRECVRQRGDGFRQDAGAAPRAFRRPRLPADRPGQCRPRVQPGAGRAAQRGHHLCGRQERQVHRSAGHRRLGRPGETVAQPAHRIHCRVRRCADGEVLRPGRAVGGGGSRQPACGHPEAGVRAGVLHGGGKQYRRRAADGFHRQVRLLAGGPAQGGSRRCGRQHRWKWR